MKEILITSSVLILALLILRLLFAKRVSRTLIYGAWILVALRLLIPVQIGQLDFSVLTAAQDVTQNIEQVATRPVSGPSKQEVYQDIVVDYLEKDPTVFIPQVQEQIREEISQGTTKPADIADKIQQKYPQQDIFVPQVEQQVQQQVEQTQTAPTLGQIAKLVWLVGMAGMVLWFAIVNLRHVCLLRRQARKLDIQSPIAVYVSEKVASPCLAGFLRPAVYLTAASAEDPQMLHHVLRHELTHYRHGDHIWSLVRCICLCIYWFDPLVWAAAYLSRRDCELACDEGAMKGMGEAERLAYGKTLLEVVSHAAAPVHLMQTATSMNETKKQLKERVGYIVKKPKISITAAICMVLVCTMVAGCVAAGPTSGTTPTTTNPPATTVPTTTQPQPDVQNVRTLVSNMHCSTIMVEDLSIASQFESELDLTVTEFTDSSVSLECALTLTNDSGVDFAHSGNSFEVQHEELGLPYYCAKALICQPGSDSYVPYDFAVDLDMGYMIFKVSANIMPSYVVASSNPDVDPLQIAEHFSMFFQIYDHTSIDTGIVTDFYYDFRGIWISENGEILGEMPIYITGTLPAEYEDGDTVEMELNFIWPKSFGYRNEGAMTYTGTVDIFANHHGHPNFHGTGTLYDADTNEQITFAFNIFPLDLDVIIYVDGNYLLGVPRDTSQAVSRLNYYKEFIFTDQKPAEPNKEVLEKFNALFGDLDSWYNKALTSEYTTPEQLDLGQFFLNAFREDTNQVSDSERAQLKDLSGSSLIDFLDITRLPVYRMNRVLQDYFGITLDDIEDAGFAELYYLKSVDCYYIIGGGASGAMDFNALSVENMDDGTIRVYYTANWEDIVYAVTLMPTGKEYIILSNIEVNAQKPLFTEPPMDCPLSEKVRQQISDAMYAQHGDPVYWKSGARYYGTYGDSIVFYVPGTWIGEGISQIGIYEFVFNPSGNLWVYKDGAIESLYNAYKQQWITDEQLAQIQSVHRNKQAPVFSTQRVDLDALKPYWQPPTQEVVDRINAIHKEKTDYPLGFDGIKGYYGTYGDLIVVFSQGNIPTSCGIQVADYYFRCSSFFNIYVFTEDAMYDLRQAYEMGLLTYEQIAMVYTNHALSGRNNVSDE